MPIYDEIAAMTVTVVDDEPSVQDVLIRAARSWHYECQSAGSAEQALELLEHQPTPIVITDLRMPGRGGIWLVREIRQRWPDIGIIVLTAGHDTDAAEQSLDAGADHYFVKPVKLDELHHVLETTRRTYVSRRASKLYNQRLERAVRRQTRRVRRTFLSAIEALVRAMEERDTYTAGHSLRVARYAMRLARELGLDDHLQHQLRLAARLHDIGKVGVPEAILLKSGALTLAETNIVHEHPLIGERVLTPIIHDRVILAAIRSHHERLDGSGYPDGLRGTRIPLLGRIIAIADCYDALTTKRPYRGAMTVPEALNTLEAASGRHYQTEFVQAFVGLVGYQPVADGVG
jgi:putative nucleotidyltransferase with HDIG domain